MATKTNKFIITAKETWTPGVFELHLSHIDPAAQDRIDVRILDLEVNSKADSNSITKAAIQRVKEYENANRYNVSPVLNEAISRHGISGVEVKVKRNLLSVLGNPANLRAALAGTVSMALMVGVLGVMGMMAFNSPLSGDNVSNGGTIDYKSIRESAPEVQIDNRKVQ